MEHQDPFSWIPIYTELADKLLEYRNNRTELIEIIKRIFKNLGKELPKLELNNELEDIDPFTVFGLFNKSLNDKNRISILKALAKEFSLKSTIPNSSENIPGIHANPAFKNSPANGAATFYSFKNERQIDDIDKLWQVFISALKFVDSPSDTSRAAFIQAYNTVLCQKGVQWNLSVRLYWVRPYEFISLEQRNRQHLNQIMPEVTKICPGFNNKDKAP